MFNSSPTLRLNEGHKLAEFYSATTAMRSRFYGPCGGIYDKPYPKPDSDSTDQITDHSAPYCNEPSATVTNKTWVLAER